MQTEINSIDYTIPGVIIAIASALILTGAVVKAVKEIRKDGWEPFHDRWLRPIRARRRERKELLLAVNELKDTCGGYESKLDEIYREVKPNGGESLKDRVIGIDNKVENLVARNRHQDETSEVPTFTLDATGQMVSANSAFRELINAEEDQLVHNNYLSLMDDDDRRRFIRSRDEAILFKMPLDAIVKFKLSGPHFVTVRLQASPDVRHGGILKGFFGTAGEVSE